MASRISEWKPAHELIGQMLDNRFQVASFIREGGMAQIFCGVQDEEPRHVAIKVMHPELANNPEVVGRFLREAKVAARLDHPNIVRILTVGEEHGLLYMVMELIVGDDISEPIKERGSFSEARSAQIIIDTCSALQHAHERGVVHRDIKPENIMLCKGLHTGEIESLKVLDFGIAKIFDDEKNAPVVQEDDVTEQGVRSVLTRVGTMIGTPAYMSPEQGRADPIDPRTDIYSMGVLLYEMVTGRLPFEGATPVHVIARHVHDAVPLPSSHGVVHPGLETVIMRALEKDPNNRQPSAKAMAEELRALLPELSSVAGASAAPIEAWLSRKPPPPEAPKLWTDEPLAALAEVPVSRPSRSGPSSAKLRPALTEPVMQAPPVDADQRVAKRDARVEPNSKPPAARVEHVGDDDARDECSRADRVDDRVDEIESAETELPDGSGRSALLAAIPPPPPPTPPVRPEPPRRAHSTVTRRIRQPTATVTVVVPAPVKETASAEPDESVEEIEEFEEAIEIEDELTPLIEEPLPISASNGAMVSVGEPASAPIDAARVSAAPTTKAPADEADPDDPKTLTMSLDALPASARLPRPQVALPPMAFDPAPTSGPLRAAKPDAKRQAEVRRLTKWVNVLLGLLVVTLTVVAVLLVKLLLIR